MARMGPSDPHHTAETGGVEITLRDRIIRLRRELHRHPELSEREERTAGLICSFLEELGIPHRTGVGGHGVVAHIDGRSSGPVVALRADIDALPISEETGLAFTSTVEGVMHACGHDGHTAMLLGTAVLLRAEPPPHPVRLLFQPAEERGSGAEMMIDDGAIDGVAAVFGGHLDINYPVGELVVTDGAVNAASDYFTIHVKGKTGHAARPHQAVDAVVVGASLVTALQTVVSREVDPAGPAVLTVGSFHAGTAENVIAGSARLAGTIRTLDPEIRRHLCNSVARMATAVGQLHGCTVDAEVREGNPPVVNEPAMTELARRAAAAVVGGTNVTRMHSLNMGSEDFGRYLERVPGCYIRYGGRAPGTSPSPAHSSRFDFDERALGVGARWLDVVARLAGQELAG
ncbi:MAG: M20 family metallopeptidase [bacterium]|nr:M20 family metallopeptidase [bacterium]MDE0290449.1 M20 family metallopeptidase [bacterium]MDE0437789.1 M20 family metallopeptidase [bacterium]